MAWAVRRLGPGEQELLLPIVIFFGALPPCGHGQPAGRDTHGNGRYNYDLERLSFFVFIVGKVYFIWIRIKIFDHHVG